NIFRQINWRRPFARRLGDGSNRDRVFTRFATLPHGLLALPAPPWLRPQPKSRWRRWLAPCAAAVVAVLTSALLFAVQPKAESVVLPALLLIFWHSVRAHFQDDQISRSGLILTGLVLAMLVVAALLTGKFLGFVLLSFYMLIAFVGRFYVQSSYL